MADNAGEVNLIKVETLLVKPKEEAKMKSEYTAMSTITEAETPKTKKIMSLTLENICCFYIQ